MEKFGSSPQTGAAQQNQFYPWACEPISKISRSREALALTPSPR
eukprot:CAMPEP_0204270188 /NCGR_PEP_ID=MMETSP0468-20130131/18430_1 /ASSEMBLY_ACC=CAM_ASM_000383 /TAXON_ID=2969 /ORGANISM="Oxyrrhis marina" /LENGTH=43 /DNA_ID= /DNA_START= /DNA_END= /DNA_ORIENTATION=